MMARYALPASLFVVTAFGAVSGSAQDSAQDSTQNPEEMVNCVSLSRVDHTEVVDENTLLFYMRGNEIYRNVLPHRCPGLDSDEQFMYRVTTTQLCNVDVITVLDNIGAGFMPGASCGLGKFQPVSEAAVAEIKAIAERDEE